MQKCLLLMITLFLFGSSLGVAADSAVLYSDDFENGMEHWITDQPDYVSVVEVPGKPVNHVLQLKPRPGRFVHALLSASDGYRNYRLEGDMWFPFDGDGYLGLIYNHQKQATRSDFGVLYFKSNGSYVRVSPHYDGNPSWRLHEELKVPLVGELAIEPRRWYRFRLDVFGQVAALYLNNSPDPIVVYSAFAQPAGSIGLEARPGEGDPVWVDNIRVTSLPRGFVPKAEHRPQYTPSAMLQEWEFAGPFKPMATQASSGDSGNTPTLAAPPSLPDSQWLPIRTDHRGMLLTGRITEYRGERKIAWFRHRFATGSEEKSLVSLRLSTANPIEVWLNGKWLANVEPEYYSMFDFLDSTEHPGSTVALPVQSGENTLILRVNGDRFAGGGFYAALIRTGAHSKRSIQAIH